MHYNFANLSADQRVALGKILTNSKLRKVPLNVPAEVFGSCDASNFEDIKSYLEQYVSRYQNKRVDQLRAKQDWIKQRDAAHWQEPKKNKGAQDSSEKEEMSSKYPKLTKKQAELAESKAKETGINTLPDIASDFSDHADAIIEHAAPGMKQQDLTKWIGEQKETWAKEDKAKVEENPNEVTRPDGKKEDRTQSSDEDEKYPVDKSVEEYTKYVTDSFIASLVKVAQDGTKTETDADYMAARNRIGALYKYARAHNLKNKSFEVEAFNKEFKIPDTWAKAKDEDKIGKIPETVGALVDLYRKCQNYDFRFTITEGKYRFTKEFNELYKTFYFLFLVCHLIKNDKDRVNDNFTFKQRTKETNLQQLYNEILALLNKIHKDSFGKESDVKELNIEGQSNKAVDRKVETHQAEDTSKTDDDAPITDNSTEAGEKGEAAEEAIEKKAMDELDKKGVNQNLDLSWYPPIQKKYKDFVEAYTKQCKELENKTLGEKLLKSFQRCPAHQILSDIYKNDKSNIHNLSVFDESREMFAKIFANPTRTKEGQVYEFVPSKGGTPEMNADNEASFRDRMRNRRESSRNRKDTLTLVKEVREEVKQNKTLLALKDKIAASNKNVAVAKNFAEVTRGNPAALSMDEWRVADMLYCNTIFVIRYFGISEGSEGEKQDEKKEWLPVMQSLYKSKGKCKLAEAMFVEGIGLKKENIVFNPKIDSKVTLHTGATEPTPYNYIPAAYKSLLQAGTSDELLKYASALLPYYLVNHLTRICYLMDRRAKSEDQYNPTKGLRILCSGLSDLFEQKTLEQKDLKNLVPDNEYDLAMYADALYRLCAQGQDIDYKNENSPDYLLFGIFQKWLDYSFGKFIKKGKQLKVRT